MGRILGRLGTDVGTDKTRKIINVYRPWDGRTDKLGGEGYPLNPKLETRNQKEVQTPGLRPLRPGISALTG